MRESNAMLLFETVIVYFYNCDISVGFIKVTDAKKKSDEDQAQLEEAMATKKKQDKEIEALQERIDELQAENAKLIKSKKRLQEEVCFIKNIACIPSPMNAIILVYFKECIVYISPLPEIVIFSTPKY